MTTAMVRDAGASRTAGKLFFSFLLHSIYHQATLYRTPSLHPLPPSPQKRVGGRCLPSLRENEPLTPSLAPNARRRGEPFFFIRKQHHHPLPRSKRETEGCSILFYWETTRPTPLSLQVRVGGILPFLFIRKQPLPRTKRESKGF